jgi:hypothetical protein
MKSIFTCAIASAFAVASFGAQATASKQSQETQQETKTTTANKTAKVSTETVHGKVESYEPGKSIKVTVPGKTDSTKSFALDSKDMTVNVAADVKTGEWVSVVEKSDSNGHKSITVKPSPHKGAKKTQ